MKIDIFNHIFPARFFERYIASGAAGKEIGKRMANARVGFDLDLRFKVLEGMLRPLPPMWDVLELAHGPFQQAVKTPATFLALTRHGAPDEGPLLDRFEAMLDPGRHTLLRLPASLPAPLAVLEHEMQLNALLLRDLEARAVDQVGWPGRGGDAPLYLMAEPPLSPK